MQCAGIEPAITVCFSAHHMFNNQMLEHVILSYYRHCKNRCPARKLSGRKGFYHHNTVYIAERRKNYTNLALAKRVNSLLLRQPHNTISTQIHQVGFEPTTCGLEGRCSSTELLVFLIRF